MIKVYTNIPEGDPHWELEALYSAAGKVLATWMMVESVLQNIFSACMGTRNSAAAKVFIAAINTNARIAMVNEAVPGFLAEPVESPFFDKCNALVDAWKPLHSKTQKLSKRRHAVAHGKPVIILDDPLPSGEQKQLAARIVDPLANPLYHASPQRQVVESISLSQATEMQERFHTLAYDLSLYRNELVNLAARREGLLQP